MYIYSYWHTLSTYASTYTRRPTGGLKHEHDPQPDDEEEPLGR